ncbi:hypothetical protein [Clostridium sp.]|uniref:hypothetical protein n=1 Tax=Clostridium sp. TaxID=1506 RepID=UPI0026094FDE|nr:hypothetical protein [Clostridium sp.]
MQWFLNFEEWLLNEWGFSSVVHFEDSVTFLSGIFIGMLITIALCGRIVFRLKKEEKLGENKVQLVRGNRNGYRYYVADPKTPFEAIETLLLALFAPIFKYKSYDYRDERRTKIFLLILLITGIIIFILAVMSISNITVDHL